MKDRYHPFETMRVIAVLCVVAIHITSPQLMTNWPNISWYVLFLDTLARVSIPVYFMLNGALLLSRPPDKHFTRYIWKKILNIVLLVTVYKVAIILVAGLLTKQPQNIPTIIFEMDPRYPQFHLWFLYALIFIYIPLPLIKKLYDKGKPVLLGLVIGLGSLIMVVDLTLLILALLQITPIYLWIENIPLSLRLVVWLFYFIFGAFLFDITKNRPTSRLRAWVYFSCFMLMSLIATITLSLTSYLAKQYIDGSIMYSNITIIFASFFFYMWIRNIKTIPHRLVQIQNFLIPLSFSIYLWHPIILKLIEFYSQQTIVPNGFRVAVGSIAGIFILTVIISFLSEKSAFFKWISKI